MKQVVFYSKRVAAFALACFVVVLSICFPSSAATVATDLHADINMNVEIKYTDGTFSQSDPELIGKTPFNVDSEDWAMAAPPVSSNKQISHVRVNTDLTGYQVPSTVIPPDPVHVIKAGTYRFNDVLNITTTPPIEISIPFTVSGELNGQQVTAYFDMLTLYYKSEGDEQELQMRLTSPDIYGEGVPRDYIVYVNGWRNIFLGYEKTITIPTDSEVSAEFLEWFSANTVQQKQIHGEWKFKDEIITEDGALIRQDVNFHFDVSGESFGVNASVRFYCSSVDVAWYDSQDDWNWIMANIDRVEPTEIEVGGIVYDVAEAFGYTLPGTNPLFKDSWRLPYAPTIDLGTEPQTVSAEFYDWLLANATPLDQVIPDDSEPETPAPVGGKTVQMRVLYRVELGLAKDAVSSISVNSGTRSGSVWTPLPYTTISSKYAMDTSTGSSYIDATIQFTLPADSEVLRVYGTFYTSPFTASNIGEVVGGVQVCEFLYLDPVTDQDPSDKVEVDRIDGVVSDKLDQTGQITDTIEQLQKPSVDVNGSGAPVIGGMVVDPMQQVDPENFGSYTSVIGAIFGSGTILGYFVIAFSMIFISYVIFGKSG